MSHLDVPDFSPTFAKAKPRFAAGQTWRKPAMFLLEDYTAYNAIKGEQIIKTWRPGMRWVQVAPDDHDPDCDGDGFEFREIVAVVNVPREVSRVIYRRSWLDPAGKAFGKRKLKMTTASAFSAWVNDSAGYRERNNRRVAEVDDVREAA